MRVAIMQPTYLPWLGYFDMMSRVDTFLLLDNVQFEKKSWQQRNRIRGANGEILLTVPVKTAGRFDQRIQDVEIDSSVNFSRKHLKTIELNYQRSSHSEEAIEGLEPLINDTSVTLSEYNERLIRHLAASLGLTANILLASQLSSTGRSTELTVRQCVELGASHFLAAGGSYEYVSRETGFAKSGITVEFHEYTPAPYEQLYPGFIPYLSALDALLCLGPSAQSLIGDRT